MRISRIVIGAVIGALALLPFQLGSAVAAAAPTVTALSPTHGSTAGGTTVTVTGTNFTGVTAVKFGALYGTNVKVASSTKLTVVSPEHGAGPSNVRVTAAGGTSPIVVDHQFLYAYPPTLALSPGYGPTTGGTKVTLSGNGFAGGISIKVDGVSVPVVTDSTSGKPTITMPVHAAGYVPVQVTANGGTATASFNYAIPPRITLSATSGPAAGGTGVKINSAVPVEVMGVWFDGIGVPVFYNTSTGVVSVSSPAHEDGLVPVDVRTPGGTARAWFLYGTPTLVLSATSGPTTSGTGIDLSGTGMANAVGVLIDGVGVPIYYTVDPSGSKVSVRATPHAAGPVEVTTIGPGGVVIATAIFTYVEPESTSAR